MSFRDFHDDSLGDCGHINSRWDIHDKCIKCSSCSRESTCLTCSTWTDKTCKLAEKRTYASKKWVLAKKKTKKQKAMSESSDEETASVAQLDAPSDWRPGGRGFNLRQVRQHSFVEIDHEIFSTVILSLPLIQEGQLSVSGERMCTLLVNRLED